MAKKNRRAKRAARSAVNKAVKAASADGKITAKESRQITKAARSGGASK